MARRQTWTAVFLIAAMMLGAYGADARQNRMPTAIQEMGGDAGEIIKIAELPDSPPLKRADGTFIDLGYRFDAMGGGQWVGYVGSTLQYLPLTNEQLNALMLVGEISALPPVPVRKSSLGVWTIALAICTIGLLGMGGYETWRIRYGRLREIDADDARDQALAQQARRSAGSAAIVTQPPIAGRATQRFGASPSAAPFSARERQRAASQHDHDRSWDA